MVQLVSTLHETWVKESTLLKFPEWLLIMIPFPRDVTKFIIMPVEGRALWLEKLLILWVLEDPIIRFVINKLFFIKEVWRSYLSILPSGRLLLFAIAKWEQLESILGNTRGSTCSGRITQLLAQLRQICAAILGRAVLKVSLTVEVAVLVKIERSDEARITSLLVSGWDCSLEKILVSRWLILLSLVYLERSVEVRVRFKVEGV